MTTFNRLILGLVLAVLGYSPAAGQHDYTNYMQATGRLECEDDPTQNSGSDSEYGYAGPHCESLHMIIKDRLMATNPPMCYGGTIIYVDEGCVEGMGGFPVLGTGIACDPCLWKVKLVYTYANGERIGVERTGRTYCEAYWTAMRQVCAKTTAHGPLCAGTGRCTIVSRPHPCCCTCKPQCCVAPQCAPQRCLPRNRWRLFGRR